MLVKIVMLFTLLLSKTNFILKTPRMNCTHGATTDSRYSWLLPGPTTALKCVGCGSPSIQLNNFAGLPNSLKICNMYL